MKKIGCLCLIFLFLIVNVAPSYAAANEMNLYVEKEVQAGDQQGYHGAKFEPKVGSYLGIFAEGDQAVHNTATGVPFYFDGVPALTGKKHAMYMLYLHWGQEFDHYINHFNRAKKLNVGMQIALEPTYGLDQVQDDSYLHNFAQQAASSGIPILLRFAGEMNDRDSEWGGDPGKFIEKFRLVARVMHNEASNVAMCWAPNDYPFGPAAEWYPGDEYVDWVGVSAYPPYMANGQSEHNTKWTDRIKPIYDAYAARKPIFLAEGAPIQNVLFETTDVSWVGSKDLKEFYDEIARRYPAVKAEFYWDNNEDWGAARKCLLSGNQNILNAYKRAIANPYFLSEMNASSPVIFVDLSNPALPPLQAKSQKISAYVGNHRLDTAKVVYYINGEYAAEAVGSPYEAALDLSAYGGETVTIKADAYDRANEFIDSTTNTVSVSNIANPSSSILQVDGKNISIEAYNINGYNYFKLRDLAMAFNGTKKQFQVLWDGTKNAINVLSNQPYSPSGGELTKSGTSGSKNASPNSAILYLNGNKASFEAYDIDGHSYFKLRDLAQAMQFSVSWNESANTITINTASNN